MSASADEITTLSNRLLLLWLIDDVAKYYSIGETKAQKLAYWSQLEMTKQQEKGLSYHFKKLTYGPFSETLRADLSWMITQQFLEVEPLDAGDVFWPSYFGKKIISDFHEMFMRNRSFTNRISGVNNEYARYASYKLVDIVHSQKHPNGKITIHDTPPQAEILPPLSFEAAKLRFDITESELETLEIYLDPDFYEDAVAGLHSAQQEPLLRLDEVF